MATQVQWRRGTDTENDAFTGADGEVSVDTTNKTLRVHDGVTAGGTAVPTTVDVNAALNTKAPIANPTFTGTVAGVDKAHVGLGNVDNTSDANKPISTATQTALDGKATAAQGALADTAVQPADLATKADLVGGIVPSSQLPAFSGLELGETSATAHRGDHGKAAYDHSHLTTGNPHDVTAEQVGATTADDVAASLIATNAKGLTSTGVGAGGFVVETGTPTNGITLTTTPQYRVVTQLGIGTLAAQSSVALSVGQGIKAVINQDAIDNGFTPVVGSITAADRLAVSEGTAVIFLECQTNAFAGLWEKDVKNAIMYQAYKKAIDATQLVILDNHDSPVVTNFVENGNGRDISWSNMNALYAGDEVVISSFSLTTVTGSRVLYIRPSEGTPFTVYNEAMSQTLLDEMRSGDIAAVYISDTGRFGGPLQAAVNRRLSYNQLVGDRDHPSERFDEALTQYGHLKTFARGREHLTYAHSGLAALAAGVDTRTYIAAVGDSYTFRRDRWSGKVADKLFAEFGDGGGGWTGFGFTSSAGTFVEGGSQPQDGSGRPSFNGNIRPDTYGVIYDGTWTPYYFGANELSPDGDSVTSSTAGDYIKVDCPASPDHTAFRLFWIETADGQARYRVNGGSWTNQSMTGTVGDSGSTDITLYAGANTVEIEVVSGTVTLCGGDWRSDAAGVVFHKMGSSGSNIGNWQSPDETKQVAMWSQMDVDAVVLFDGTNSQSAGFGPESLWKLRMGQVIDRMQSAWNKPSTLIVVPAENGRTTNTYPMSDYAYQGLLLSHEDNTAFLDLQGNFGPVVADYLDDGARPLLESDLIHPTDDGGGALIASAIWQMITPY